MDFADRAARNEEIFRGVNAEIEAGAELHKVGWPLPFHCECCDATCVERVSVIPGDYERVLSERFRFIVIPGHENPDVERVVETHELFVVVEKIGEARAQIERDHPQKRHQGSD